MVTNQINRKRAGKKCKHISVYPHISNNKKILNGTPIINGTRTSVRTIVGYYQLGMNVDEILNTLSHLSHSQVHSALAYYFDHQKKIDKEIHENNEVYYSHKS
jgi:uncharacterized protein (DUF433 family)